MPLWKTVSTPPDYSPQGQKVVETNSDAPRSCWTVYTRAHQEKSLGSQLRKCGIRFYLPLAPRIQTNVDGSCQTHLPLFSRFLFVSASEDELLSVLSTGLVSRMLPVADEDRLRHDLNQLQQLIRSKTSLTVETRIDEIVGEDVSIQSGPLDGIEGRCMERSGLSRLLVPIAEIGQGVSISAEQLSLERTRSVSVEN